MNSLSHYIIVELGALMQTEVRLRVSGNRQTSAPRKITKNFLNFAELLCLGHSFLAKVREKK